jgi:hypothetical protein
MECRARQSLVTSATSDYPTSDLGSVSHSPDYPRRYSLCDHAASASASSSQYCWIDDDVSDSFKSLFKQHYRDAHKSINSDVKLEHAPTPPARLPSSAYPGYLQHSSARSGKSKLSRDPGPLPTHIPELLLDMLPGDVLDMDYREVFPQPTAQSQTPIDLASLTGIWMTHSRQLNAFPSSTSGTSGTSSHDRHVNFDLVQIPVWY